MHERHHRSRTEIVLRILEIANEIGSDGFTKYKMMYNAFLSYAQLKEYLMVLTDDELLSYDVDSHKFKITEKGHRFLETYNQMENLIKEPQQQQIGASS